MSTTTINGTEVQVINGEWSKYTLISMALNSDNFSIEHETDADYGQLEIFTLNDGLWARVREISEHQIGKEALGDRFGFAFVKTVQNDYRNPDGEDIVTFWKVEAFEDADDSEE